VPDEPFVLPLPDAGALSVEAFESDDGFVSARASPPLSELPSEPLSDLESLPVPASVLVDPDPASDPPSEAAAARVEERDAELRSFFAQPVPLKWIVGAVKALRTGDAPHTGQLVGPSAVTEWMTSKRWLFGQR
jgi:hypothetical protein